MPIPEFVAYFDASTAPPVPLPPALDAAYGPLSLPERLVCANFVATLDGIVAVPTVPRSSALISGGDRGDRFLVAMLRATADAVVIGAGTFRAHRGPWTADNAYPDAAADFAELRRSLGRSAHPTLVVLSGSGRVGESAAKLRGAIVVTTGEALDELSKQVDESTEIMIGGDHPPLDPAAVITTLSERGYRRILTEGGPALAGQLLQVGAIDELFLTVSPVIVGGGADRPRPTLATGVDLVPAGPRQARLLSVRRHGSYLYLRYQMSPGGAGN